MSEEFNYRADEVSRRYHSELNGRMTFAGAFLKFFYIRKQPKELTGDDAGKDANARKSIFSRETTDETMMTYIDNIIDRILPELDTDSMTMEDYTLQFFEAALDRIRRKHPSVNDISSYRRNIRRIYNAWAESQEDLNERIIWPEDKSKKQTASSLIKRKNRHSKPRSMTCKGEVEMFRWIYSLDNETINASDLGIILMFFLGLRNNEAAGMTFGNIREIAGTSHHCIYVTSSTVGRSKELKAGGKTQNAYRVIPLFDFLYECLMRRKDYIVDMWLEKEPDLSDEEIEKRLNVQRIASDIFSNNGVSSPDLTKRGKEVLTSILAKAGESSHFYDDVFYDFSYMRQELGLDDEDSATTYLFRRNYANHAVNLGLTGDQIRAIFGHKIEELGVKRSFFTSGDELAEIAEVLQDHPFCLLDRIMKGKEDERYYNEVRIRVANISPGHKGHVRLVASEPEDTISISFENDDLKVSGTKTTHELAYGYQSTVDIRKKMLDVYKRQATSYINATSQPQSDSSL